VLYGNGQETLVACTALALLGLTLLTATTRA